MDTVNEVVRALDGSFSAEHGIGKLKPYMMPDWRGGAELAVMRRIKAALDPLGIMNPGKVLPERKMASDAGHRRPSCSEVSIRRGAGGGSGRGRTARRRAAPCWRVRAPR